MPEGTVHEDDEFVFFQADIRSAWKDVIWGFESYSGMPQGFFKKFLWFGILPSDFGHIEGTCFCGIEAVFLRESRDCCFGAYVGGVFQGVKVMTINLYQLFDRNKQV